MIVAVGEHGKGLYIKLQSTIYIIILLNHQIELGRHSDKFTYVKYYSHEIADCIFFLNRVLLAIRSVHTGCMCTV